MMLEILCAPTFPAKEDAELHEMATKLGITPEALIRSAVIDFSSKCVPTQNAAPLAGVVSLADCVPTH